MIRKRFGVVSILVIMVLLLASCGGGGGTATDTPSTGGATTSPTAMTGGETPSAATGGETPSAGAAGGQTPSAAAGGETPSAGAAGGTPSAAAGGETPSAGTAGGATPTAAGHTIANTPPPTVPNASAASQYKGVTLTYYGGQVGLDHDMDVALANQFQKDTGITINIVERNADPAVDVSTYQRLFQAQSTDIDVLMMDVIWPGTFGQDLLDLTPKLGDASKAHYPGIVANDTINGKLIAMPWFSDYGILYYRTDLLQKYGYSAPPKTWQELTDMAKKIQDGEKASNPNFQGFVFQGSASEGLTCNVMEWLASSGGGQVIENGKVTINNPQAVAMLKMAQGWVGTISSKAVTNYHEEDARTAFQGGNAAFERNWPYAYVQASDPSKSQVAGKFDVAPLPHGSGASDQSYGTIGGWALGVSKFSKNPDASIEWVRYLTSPEVQKWRAQVGSVVPTIQSLASDPDVLAAEPFLKNTSSVQRVGRPSTALGQNYSEASADIFQGINQVLNGADAQSNVTDIANKLTNLLK